MKTRASINRREFLRTSVAASTVTILPRHVIGGSGRVPPSDKINVSLIGAGTQGLSMLMGSWLPRKDLQVTSVVDPNKNSDDYRSWSRHGQLHRIRRFLDEPDWGSTEDGIRCGRDIGKYITDTYYAKNREVGSYESCRTYADFREMLDEEADVDGCLIVTPEHLHGTIALASMRKGKHTIMHKTLANTYHEAKLVGDTARKSDAVTHFLAWHDQPSDYKIRDWIEAGAVGNVQEVHLWTNRPVWPQGWLDWLEEEPIPDGLDWDLWLGPTPDMPYNSNYTHCLFRGWYEFGSGCLGDVGQYTLWRVYRFLGGMPAPVVVEGFPSTDAQVIDSVSGPCRSEVAFPKSGIIRTKYPANGSNGPIDIFWYEGGARPPTPDEFYPTGEELGQSGLMVVGTDGKIMSGFDLQEPRILPEARMREFESAFTTDVSNLRGEPEEWIHAIKAGTRCPAGFENVQGLAEASCLGNLSLRFGRRLVWDNENEKILNAPELEPYLTRAYRKGWEL